MRLICNQLHRVCIEDHDTGGYCIPYFDSAVEDDTPSTLLQIGGSSLEVVLDANGDPATALEPTLGTAHQIVDKCQTMLPCLPYVASDGQLASSVAAAAGTNANAIQNSSSSPHTLHPPLPNGFNSAPVHNVHVANDMYGNNNVQCGNIIEQRGGGIEHYIGIRPGRRDGANVSFGTLEYNGIDVVVAHNYGHGGAGIMTAFGCAREVEAKCRQMVLGSHSQGRSHAKL